MQRMIIAITTDDRPDAVFGLPLRNSFVQDMVELTAPLRNTQVRICTPATADRVFAESLSLGSTLLLAGDVPHLPLWRLVDAFEYLEHAVDLVIGPAENGGCYLIGMRPDLAIRIDTQTILSESPQNLLQVAQFYGWSSSLLPAWYRLRDYADLTRLADDLTPFTTPVARYTRALLSGDDLEAQAVGA